MCALLLTIAISAATASPQNFLKDNSNNDLVAIFHSLAITTCAASSVICIWNSVWVYGLGQALQVCQHEYHPVAT